MPRQCLALLFHLSVFLPSSPFVSLRSLSSVTPYKSEWVVCTPYLGIQAEHALCAYTN